MSAIKKVLIVVKSKIPASFNCTVLSATPDQKTQESVARISQQVLAAARRFFPAVTMLTAQEMVELQEPTRRLEEYDLVIPIGGDGTFMAAAHCVESARTLMLGVNSNPRVSKGFLTPLKFFEESFGTSLRRVFESVAAGRYQTERRKRFEFFRHASPQKRLLGLNDFFLGPVSVSKSVFYDFKTRLSSVRSVRSTGCLLYTGTGATGWAKSMHFLGAGKINLLAQHFGLTLSPEQVEAFQAGLDAQYLFHPAASVIGFIHREMIPSQRDEPTEGYSDQFFVRNKSLDGGCIAVDGWLSQIASGEEFSIALAPEEHDLSCLTLDLKEVFACAPPAAPA